MNKCNSTTLYPIFMFSDPRYAAIMDSVCDKYIFNKILIKKFIIITQAFSIDSFLTTFLVYNKARNYDDHIEVVPVEDLQVFRKNIKALVEHANGRPLVFINVHLTLNDIVSAISKKQEVYFLSSQQSHMREYQALHKKTSENFHFFYTTTALASQAYRVYYNTSHTPYELTDMLSISTGSYVTSHEGQYFTKIDLSECFKDLYKRKTTLSDLRDYFLDTELESDPKVLIAINNNITVNSFVLRHRSLNLIYINNSYLGSVNYDTFLKRVIANNIDKSHAIEADAIVQLYYRNTYIQYIVTRLDSRVDLMQEFSKHKFTGDSTKLYIQVPLDSAVRSLTLK